MTERFTQAHEYHELLSEVARLTKENTRLKLACDKFSEAELLAQPAQGVNAEFVAVAWKHEYFDHAVFQESCPRYPESGWFRLYAALADAKAALEQREVGYGLYLEFNGELHLEYPVEASYDDCVLRLQEYDRNRGYEIRACYIIPTGLEK